MSSLVREIKKHFSFFSIMIYILLFICIAYISYIINMQNFDSLNDESDISAKMKNISRDISSASSELSLIQRELESRIETVERLKSEAEQAEQVISLTDDQVNAIQTKIHQEIDASNTKSLLQSILINLFFFFAGLIVPLIIKSIQRYR